ncbi:glucan biosynthesis protein [Terrihabitans sp. B22-R8]|uniref:glucan biosynthesis protein n=1 Tax=Terrihabitans sp. B22-R8 TaxID=3425128 RepID=UPI00403C0A71
MRRRDLLLGAAAVPFASGLLYQLTQIPLAQTGEATPFTAAQVRQLARQLAEKPFKAPDVSLPENLRDLPYDLYRDLRWIPERSLWRGEGLPFEVQFFHRGFLYSNRVDVSVVTDGQARPVVYSPSQFTFGRVPPPPADANLGFSGFRIHGPINNASYFDEIAVFQGASYFRSLAKGQTYGLSARGLAIKTADGAGEEFPVFRQFWLERPAPGTSSIVVHAILDSESAAAAYRFTIRPGDVTIFDVEMAIYPRVEITQAGLAPLTSMFYFDSNDRIRIDDFRPGVHDSDGLAMYNGRGERIWRPLTNPTKLQISVFRDVNPRGFGLMQRQRTFADYEDLEARYERRPSLWVEPIGDWGEGGVQLIEIPTQGEIHDNIVAFWRPRQPLQKGSEYLYNYRLHWCANGPTDTPDLARMMRTSAGAIGENRRLFVIDVEGARVSQTPIEDIRVDVSASAGKIEHPVLQVNPENGGWRINFHLIPDDNPLIELRAVVMRGDQPVSEVWVYRWTQ